MIKITKIFNDKHLRSKKNTFRTISRNDVWQRGCRQTKSPVLVESKILARNLIKRSQEGHRYPDWELFPKESPGDAYRQTKRRSMFSQNVQVINGETSSNQHHSYKHEGT